MGESTVRSRKAIAIGAAVVLIAGGVVWWVVHSRSRVVSPPAVAARRHRSNDPLQPAVDAYNRGKYREAEAMAPEIIAKTARSKDPIERRKSVEARYVLAFCSARRRDMTTARERFTVLQHEAAKLPDKGKQAPMPGVVRPTLEEEGAYQHAVCTAALGDKKAAEAEYMKFIRDYPESPLTGAAQS
jgi:hypothetical protein